MTPLQLALGITSILLSIAIIAAIMGQESKRSGVAGVISGGSDTYLSKNRSRSVDAFLSRVTVVLLIVFGILMLVANYVAIFLKK